MVKSGGLFSLAIGTGLIVGGQYIAGDAYKNASLRLALGCLVTGCGCIVTYRAYRFNRLIPVYLKYLDDQEQARAADREYSRLEHGGRFGRSDLM